MSTDKTQIPAEYKSWRKSDTTWTLGPERSPHNFPKA